MLVLLLFANAVITLFSSGYVRYAILQQNKHLPVNLSISNSLESLITYGRLAQIALAALVVMFFCLWVNRANKNGWMLDAPRMRATPAAAVTSFFTPVAGLWKPYVAMKEIRSASYASDHSLRNTLTLWWTFTVASLTLLLVAALFYISGGTDSTLTGCKIELISAPLGVLRDYFTTVLVLSITGIQNRRSTFWQK